MARAQAPDLGPDLGFARHGAAPPGREAHRKDTFAEPQARRARLITLRPEAGCAAVFRLVCFSFPASRWVLFWPLAISTPVSGSRLPSGWRRWEEGLDAVTHSSAWRAAKVNWGSALTTLSADPCDERGHGCLGSRRIRRDRPLRGGTRPTALDWKWGRAAGITRGEGKELRRREIGGPSAAIEPRSRSVKCGCSPTPGWLELSSVAAAVIGWRPPAVGVPSSTSARTTTPAADPERTCTPRSIC